MASTGSEPRVGDKVLFTRPLAEHAHESAGWSRRRATPSLVVDDRVVGEEIVLQEGDHFGVAWHAAPADLTVVERATYLPEPAEPTARSEYAAGLVELARLLVEHPEVPLPYEGHLAPLTLMFLDVDTARAEMAAAVRAIPTDWSKDAGTEYFRMDGGLRGLKLRLTAYRASVCERVVVGTRPVVKQIPDPAVVVPLVDVVEDEEIVDWRCRPVLAAESTVDADR